MMFPTPFGTSLSASQWEKKPEPASHGGLHLFAHHAMACAWSIRVPDEEHGGFDLDYATQAAEAVWDEVDRLESELSRFVESSDIAQVNARAGSGDWVAIGASTWECLSWALDVGRATLGAFDCALGQVLQARRGEDGKFHVGEAMENWPGPLLPYLEMANDPLRARLNHAEARLDLGAIGKGYALDCAASVLREWSIENALLHAGQSSVLAMGGGPQVLGHVASRPHDVATSRGWPVELRAPWDAEKSLGAILLRDAALGGSGREAQGYHIVDPRTGLGARGWRASWVACPRFAALADALSTANMVLSADEIRAFCAPRPQVSVLAWREGEFLRVGEAFEDLDLVDSPQVPPGS